MSFIGRRSSPAPASLVFPRRAAPDPVVLEVAEPETDPLDALDQVVDRFGRSVAHAGDVEVADLLEPGLDGASQLLDLGRHRGLQAVLLQLFEHRPGLAHVERPIEVPQPFLHPIGNRHLGVRVAELEQRDRRSAACSSSFSSPVRSARRTR